MHAISLTTSHNQTSTPETFDIVSTTVDIASRKNLAQISKMLTQITSGSEFGDESPAYIPVNDYIRKSIVQISAWLMDGMLAANSHLYASSDRTPA